MIGWLANSIFSKRGLDSKLRADVFPLLIGLKPIPLSMPINYPVELMSAVFCQKKTKVSRQPGKFVLKIVTIRQIDE
jgi:hypothetical protein